MGKRTLIEYSCDRCGKKLTDPLSGEPFSVGRFRFMHIFKWWVPQPVGQYKLHYICHECFKSFKEWYGNKDA